MIKRNEKLDFSAFYKQIIKRERVLVINSLWSILGSFGSKGLNFLAIAYIAKLLGPSGFGTYNVIQSTIGLFGTISGLGLGLAATKLVAENKDKDLIKVGQIIGTLYALSIIVSVIVAVILFGFSNYIAANLFNRNDLTIMLQITSIIVIFDSINGVQNGILAGFEAFKEVTILNITAGLVGAILITIGAFFFTILGVIVMLLISKFLTVLITSSYIKKIVRHEKIKLTMLWTKDIMRPIFNINVPSFLSSLATTPISWVSTTIFVNQPSGYADFGVYNAANQLRQLVLFLPDSAGKVSIPTLARAYGNSDMYKFKKAIFTTLFLNLILSLLPALFIYFFTFLFKDLIGNQFIISDNMVQTILLTSILVAVTNAIGYIFICSNLIWYDFVLRIFWGISLIVTLILFGRFNGALGYSVSVLCAFGIQLILQLIFIGVKFRHLIF